MNASELIKALKDLIEKYGDLEVEYTYNDCGYILTGSEEVREVRCEFEPTEFDPEEYEPKRFIIY